MDFEQLSTQKETAISTAVAEAVAECAAHITSLDMPLAAGLRAAAQEADSATVARALCDVAARLDQGQRLSEVVADARQLPPYLHGFLRAADQASDAGLMFAQWLENRRAARQHWRQVVATIAYPALTVALLVLVFVLFAIVVVGPFKVIVQDFQVRLSPSARAFFWMGDTGVWLFLGGLAIVGTGLIIARLFGGASNWSWLVMNVPLVGLLWHWTGVAEMLRYLSLLVERRVALPSALRLVADCVGDAYVAGQCRILARRVENGSSLTMALIAQRTLPLSIVPLVHWGERHDCLSEGLRSAAEMLEGRLQVRTAVLLQIVPPLIFLLIGGIILAIIGAFFGTIIPLIRAMM